MKRYWWVFAIAAGILILYAAAGWLVLNTSEHPQDVDCHSPSCP